MIIDELVTDRKPIQSDRLEELSAIGWQNMTQGQKDEWLHGDATEIVYWLLNEVMRCLDGVIYVIDENGTNRGAYNWTDLNRVCEAMEYLYQTFTRYGYSISAYERVQPTSTRTEWTLSDIPTPAQMNQYLENVRALRTAIATMSTTPAAPSSMNSLTSQGANDIEQILIDTNALWEAAEKVFLRSGMLTAFSGTEMYFVNQ